MTFDALPDDFSEFTSHTEDGILFEAVDGAPEHFHAEENFDNGTTGAILFSDDGSPFRLSFANGGLFTLISLYVYDIDTGSGPVVFTTSGGATQQVDDDDLSGVVNFGPAFAGVNFVRIDIPGGADGRFFGIDDVTATPEPSTLVFALMGAACLLCARRHGRK
jgi:hypothetical protein